MDLDTKISTLLGETITDRRERLITDYTFLVTLRNTVEDELEDPTARLNDILMSVKGYNQILRFIGEHDEDQKKIISYCIKLLKKCSEMDNPNTDNNVYLLYLTHRMLIVYLLRMPTPGNELYRDLHFDWESDLEEIDKLM